MAWFRLAAMLGMGVRQAQQTIDAREFSEWQAYMQIEPHGAIRDEFHARLICTAIAAAAGIRSEMDDFRLDFWRPPMTADQVRDAIRRVRIR